MACYIFGAGSFYGLDRCPRADDFIIAADGGWLACRKTGITPDLLLGDFDSLSTQPDFPNILRVPVEKDDTDGMLAVKLGLKKGFRDYLVYGSLDGPRLDHTVANYQLLQYLCDHGAQGTLVGLSFCATVIRNGELRFPGGKEGDISVFCMGPEAKGITIEGLYYELHHGVLTPGFPLGVSNHFTGEPVHISVRDGSLLVIWDKTAGFPVTEQ